MFLAPSYVLHHSRPFLFDSMTFGLPSNTGGLPNYPNYMSVCTEYQAFFAHLGKPTNGWAGLLRMKNQVHKINPLIGEQFLNLGWKIDWIAKNTAMVLKLSNIAWFWVMLRAKFVFLEFRKRSWIQITLTKV